MLYSLKEAIRTADEKGHALAAFNVFGYEDAQAVCWAAEAENKPVVLMVNRDAVAHMPLPIIGPILLKLAADAKVPVCVHLDHAVEIAVIAESISVGFTSVMYDGSQLPVEDNIRTTKQVVEMAHVKDVSVEAEIGSVGYSDKTGKAALSVFTTVEEADRFFEETRVDALAVSVGTVHRMVKQGTKLRFDLLADIHQSVGVPLVIHGASGVRDEDLIKLVECGARKINLGTALRLAFGNELRRQFEENPDVFDRIALFKRCMVAVQEQAAKKLRLL